MSSFNNIKPPQIKPELGGQHPVNQVKYFLLNLLKNFGFSELDGPEIESEEFNFDMLNIKKSHPARQMHDTFYINNKFGLLRTHTSPVQIRSMLNSQPPFAYSSAGKVYRKDDDATHLPMFHQVEGICINQEITFAQLKDLIHKIIYAIFDEEVQIRFRPSYFPFTEPSAEVDILWDENKWLEILGCGMVHPNVLSNAKIDPKIYSGYAFGMGIERLAMLYYGVKDLRTFFDNDLTFLRQFS